MRTRDIHCRREVFVRDLFGGKLVRGEFVDWRTLEWELGDLHTAGEGTSLGIA